MPLRMPRVQQVVSAGNSYGILPSPDGKWLLRKSREAEFTMAIETASRRSVQWKSVPRIQIDHAWFPDSNHWLEFVPAADGKQFQPIVHSIGTPDRQTAVIPGLLTLIGISSSSRFVTVTINVNPELWEYDLEGKKTVPEKHPLAFPSACALYEVEGSPDGRHIAYLVQESRDSLITRLLDRVRPRQNDSTKTIALWVSRTDGSDLHRVGYERVTEAAGLHWSPDCKKLGIFLDDNFYVVPAN